MGLDGYEEQRRGPLEALPNQQNKGPAANRSLKTMLLLEQKHAYKALNLPPYPKQLIHISFRHT